MDAVPAGQTSNVYLETVSYKRIIIINRMIGHSRSTPLSEFMPVVDSRLRQMAQIDRIQRFKDIANLYPQYKVVPPFSPVFQMRLQPQYLSKEHREELSK